MAVQKIHRITWDNAAEKPVEHTFTRTPDGYYAGEVNGKPTLLQVTSLGSSIGWSVVEARARTGKPVHFFVRENEEQHAELNTISVKEVSPPLGTEQRRELGMLDERGRLLDELVELRGDGVPDLQALRQAQRELLDAETIADVEKTIKGLDAYDAIKLRGDLIIASQTQPKGKVRDPQFVAQADSMLLDVIGKHYDGLFPNDVFLNASYEAVGAYHVCRDDMFSHWRLRGRMPSTLQAVGQTLDSVYMPEPSERASEAEIESEFKRILGEGINATGRSGNAIEAHTLSVLSENATTIMGKFRVSWDATNRIAKEFNLPGDFIDAFFNLRSKRQLLEVPYQPEIERIRQRLDVDPRYEQTGGEEKRLGEMSRDLETRALHQISRLTISDIIPEEENILRALMVNCAEKTNEYGKVYGNDRVQDMNPQYLSEVRANIAADAKVWETLAQNPRAAVELTKAWM